MLKLLKDKAMFEDINTHRQEVKEQIQKGFEIGFTENSIYKAHNVGDIHPNGKWVWTRLPSGRYDWRVIKKTSAESSGSAPANHPSLSGLKGVSNMKDYLTTFNSKYTDMSKVEVMRTSKGNWDVHYDGHRLGIFAGDQVPESTAKKMGWLRTDSKNLTGSKRDTLTYKNAYKNIGDVQDFLKTEGISSKHLTKITTRFHDVDLSQRGDKIFGSGTISLFFDVNADENGVSVRVKNNDDSHSALKKLNKELRNEFLGGTAVNVNYFYLNSNDDLKKFVEIYKKIKKTAEDSKDLTRSKRVVEEKTNKSLGVKKTSDTSWEMSRGDKRYYVWKVGDSFRGSPVDPKKNMTDANKIQKFDKKSGFESVDDVKEYVEKWVLK